MPFQKGNKLSPGRKKTKATIIKEFVKAHPMAYDEMMQLLYDIAKDKNDKDAAQYICNRLKGTPRQTVDVKAIVDIDYPLVSSK